MTEHARSRLQSPRRDGRGHAAPPEAKHTSSTRATSAVPGGAGGAVQRRLADAIHASPHQALQRERIAESFGPVAQRAAVKDTKLGNAALIPEVGADFRNNHMAESEDAAKVLSKSADRLARTFKNTVVIGADADVKKALGDAPYSSTPVSVSGLNYVNITTHTTGGSFKPEDVTGQTVVKGGGAVKMKVRLVADDDAKTTTAPTKSDTGPILLATGVSGGQAAPAPARKANPKPKAPGPRKGPPKPGGGGRGLRKGPGKR